jgi:hypothetical protein
VVSLRSSRGIALITVLLVSSLVSTMALGLALIVSINQLVVRNHRESTALAASAQAGLELAAHALSSADWNAVLAGTALAPGADGAPSGPRALGGGRTVDLSVQTNLLNCGSRAGCSAGQLQAVSVDRPWGVNNPHWRLYLYGPLAGFARWRHPAAAYLLVWIADDGRESDGNPDADGAPPDGSGRNVLRVHAAAFGHDGGRRAIEAELVRVCRPAAAADPCPPAIRVQSRRDLRESLP